VEQKQLEEEIFRAVEKILNYTEVAIISNEQYKKLRSKILRIANDLIRKIGKGE